LEVTAGGQLRASASFRVDVPFFYDDSQYFARVAQLEYVASSGEMQILRRTPRAERESAWRDFWKKKDQTPTTERNEREDEYLARIDYADEHFGHGDRGWRSDRGRVYVRYGAADQVDVRPFEIDAPAYEIWYYYELNRKFVFLDRFGAGEMILQNPEVFDER
jgi:GWxTD domain-containing protein